MSDGFRIEATKVIILPGKFDFKEYKKTLIEALEGINADHDIKYSRGLAPDGSPQKTYSPAYAAAKAAFLSQQTRGRARGGVSAAQISGGAVRANLSLTGDLLASKDIDVKESSVELSFKGDHYAKNLSAAGLATALARRGFKLHFFSEENQDLIQDMVADRVEELALEALKVGPLESV